MLPSQMKNLYPRGFLNLSGALQLKASVRQMCGWGKSQINNKMTGILRFKVQGSTISTPNDGTKPTHFHSAYNPKSNSMTQEKLKSKKGTGRRELHTSLKLLPSSVPKKIYPSLGEAHGYFLVVDKRE